MGADFLYGKMLLLHCKDCGEKNGKQKKGKKRGFFLCDLNIKVLFLAVFAIVLIIKKGSILEEIEKWEKGIFLDTEMIKYQDLVVEAESTVYGGDHGFSRLFKFVFFFFNPYWKIDFHFTKIGSEHAYSNWFFGCKQYRNSGMIMSSFFCPPMKITGGRVLKEIKEDVVRNAKEEIPNQPAGSLTGTESDDMINGQIPIASDEIVQGIVFYCFIFLSATMLQFILSKIHKLNIPVSVIWFLYGMLVYAIAKNVNILGDNPLHTSIINARNIDSSVLYFILLPILLYEATQDINYYAFRNFIYGGIGLAVVGVALQVGVLGILFYFSFMYEQDQSPLSSSFLLASVLSSTDPVAVLSILSVVDAPSKISSMFHVESLINDGSSVLLFQFFYYLTIGYKANASEYTILFVKLLFLSPIFGIAMAMLMFLWINMYRKYYYNQCLATITMCYVCYFVSEYYFNLSGPLAIVCYGLFINAYGHIALDEVAQRKHKEIIELLALMGNSGIFIISGIVSFGMMENVFNENWTFFFYILLTYFYLLLARSLMILVFTPFLARIDYKVNWKEILLLIWGGLRGGIVLVLGLRIEAAKDISDNLTKELAYYISGSVLLILTIQGLSFECLYRLLNTYPPNPFRIVYLEKVLKMIDYNYNIRRRNLQNHWLFKDTNILQFSNKIVPELYWRKMNKIGHFDLNLPDIYMCLQNISACDISRWENMYDAEKQIDNFENFSFSNINELNLDNKGKKTFSTNKDDSHGRNRKTKNISANGNSRIRRDHVTGTKTNDVKDRKYKRAHNSELNQLYENQHNRKNHYKERFVDEERNSIEEDGKNSIENDEKKKYGLNTVRNEKKDVQEENVVREPKMENRSHTSPSDNVIIKLFSQNASELSSEFYECVMEKKKEKKKKQRGIYSRDKDKKTGGHLQKHRQAKNFVDIDRNSSYEYTLTTNKMGYSYNVGKPVEEPFPLINSIVDIDGKTEKFDPKYNLRLIEHATDVPKTLSDEQIFKREEKIDENEEEMNKLERSSNGSKKLFMRKNKFLEGHDKKRKKKEKEKRKKRKRRFYFLSDHTQSREEDIFVEDFLENENDDYSSPSCLFSNEEREVFSIYRNFCKRKKGGDTGSDYVKKKKKKQKKNKMRIMVIPQKEKMEKSEEKKETIREGKEGEKMCKVENEKTMFPNVTTSDANEGRDSTKKEDNKSIVPNKIVITNTKHISEQETTSGNGQGNGENADMLLMGENIIIKINQGKTFKVKKKSEQKNKNVGECTEAVRKEPEEKEVVCCRNGDNNNKGVTDNVSVESTCSKQIKKKRHVLPYNSMDSIENNDPHKDRSPLRWKEPQKIQRRVRKRPFVKIFKNMCFVRKKRKQHLLGQRIKESISDRRLNKKLRNGIEKYRNTYKQENEHEKGIEELKEAEDMDADGEKRNSEKDNSQQSKKERNSVVSGVFRGTESCNYDDINELHKLNKRILKRNNTVDVITQRCDTDRTLVFEEFVESYEKKEHSFFRFIKRKEEKWKKADTREISKAESHESYIHMPNISKEMDDVFHLTLKKKKVVRKEREGELYILIFNTCRESYKKLYVNGFISGECLLTLNAILDLSADFALKKVRMNPIKAWADALDESKIKKHISRRKLNGNDKLNNRKYLDHRNGFEFEFYALLSKLKIHKKRKCCFTPVALNIFFAYENCKNDLQIVLSYVDVHQCTLDKGGVTMKLLLGKTLLRSYYRNIYLAKRLIPYIVKKYSEVVKYCLIKIGTDMLLHLKKTIVNEQAANGLLLSQDNEKLNGIFEEQQVKVNRYRPYFHYIFKKNLQDVMDNTKSEVTAIRFKNKNRTDENEQSVVFQEQQKESSVPHSSFF